MAVVGDAFSRGAAAAVARGEEEGYSSGADLGEELADGGGVGVGNGLFVVDLGDADCLGRSGWARTWLSQVR